MQFRSNTNRSNFQNGSSLKKKNSKEKRGEKNPTRKNTPDRAEEIISSYHEYTRIIQRYLHSSHPSRNLFLPFISPFPVRYLPLFLFEKCTIFPLTLAKLEPVRAITISEGRSFRRGTISITSSRRFARPSEFEILCKISFTISFKMSSWMTRRWRG